MQMDDLFDITQFHSPVLGHEVLLLIAIPLTRSKGTI